VYERVEYQSTSDILSELKVLEEEISYGISELKRIL